MLRLQAAVDLTRTGDLWLFRGTSTADHAIRAVTNAPVNHVGMAVVLEFLSRNRHLESISHHLERNEGYAKSLREDREFDTDPWRGNRPGGKSA